MIVERHVLNSETKRERSRLREEVVLEANMNVLDIELDATEKSRHQAEQRRLFELLAFLLSLSFGLPGFRVGIAFRNLFIIFLLLFFAQFVAVLLALSLGLLLFLPEAIFFRLLQLLYDLVHHSNIGHLIVAVVGAVLGIIRKVAHLGDEVRRRAQNDVDV